MHHPALVDGPDATVTTFFEGLCRDLMIMRRDLCQAVGGTYRFELRGQKGPGTSILDFLQGTVSAAASAAADLTIAMSTADFAALLQGRLVAGEAARDGRIRVSGDARLLVNLVSFLQPMG